MFNLQIFQNKSPSANGRSFYCFTCFSVSCYGKRQQQEGQNTCKFSTRILAKAVLIGAYSCGWLSMSVFWCSVELDFKQQEDKLQPLMKRLCPTEDGHFPPLPYPQEAYTSTPKRKSKADSKKHARWKLWFLWERRTISLSTTGLSASPVVHLSLFYHIAFCRPGNPRIRNPISEMTGCVMGYKSGFYVKF